MTKKTVLITGCSSGFGKLTAKTFHTKGWNVIATMRSPHEETELTALDDVFVTALDVTVPTSIDQAVGDGVARFGDLDAVVNNAGYGGHALFEQMSDEAIRAMYETNVFGVMNVMRATLPILRAKRSGTVVNVTSMAGMLGLPNSSIYTSTKFAVEGLTEAMALEYRPFGVAIKSVLPGAYPTTRFGANTDDAVQAGDNELGTYGQKLYTHIQTIGTQMAAQGDSIADPQEVADQIFACITDDTPIHNPVGADSAMLIGMMGAPPRQPFLEQLAAMLIPTE
ncbi:MAG: SDR family oxidoreductase [Acidobacteriota bacterium]